MAQCGASQDLPTSSELSDGLYTHRAPSKFWDLPRELRLMVYANCIDQWQITISFDQQANRFKVGGLPNNALLLTSKFVYRECISLYRQAFGGTLKLADIRVHRKGQFGFQSSLEMVATLGIDRVLSQVRKITIENGTTGMLVLLPWYKFPLLERVELEDRLATNPFAVGRISQYWPFDATTDADGRCEICGVFGYDQWTCVPECVAEGRVRVVSIRRGFASGACLRTVVEHKADCGEFVERVYEDETGGWKWIMSEAGSL